MVWHFKIYILIRLQKMCMTIDVWCDKVIRHCLAIVTVMNCYVKLYKSNWQVIKKLTSGVQKMSSYR